MTGRRLHLAALLFVLSFATASPRHANAAEATTASSRPNILWITVEDLSPRLGCYGDNTVPTPNIDQVASEGLRFTHTFGTYGVCGPNRHCLIMGMYPTSTGAMAMRTWKRTAALSSITDPELLAIPTYEATPPPEAKCFTEYLRAAGYYCTNNAKTDYQFRPPVTAWDESHRKAHWRNRPDKETPFFSVFNFNVTHESGTFKQRSPQVVDPATVPLPPYYPDTPIVRRDVARHYDNIAVLDSQVGKLLAELEADGLTDNTIVFFFSDHGDGLPRMKRWVYDSGIHVPLIVRHPQRKWGGKIAKYLISFVDFAPTMLSLAGVDIPEHMQGNAFLGPASKKNKPRKYIHAARDRMDPAPETIRAVRDMRFKYVRNYRTDLPYIGYIPYRDRAEIMREIIQLARDGKLGPQQWQFTTQTKPQEELYDTQADPHEIHNLAADPKYANKLAELRAAHEKWKTETNDLGHMPETELIKKLWPPHGVQPTTARPRIMLSTFTGSFPKELLGDWLGIHCSTPGASIAYRVAGEKRWQLYQPLTRIAPDTKLEVQAIRLGYRPSSIVTWPAPKIEGQPWQRHTIDNTSAGADGVKLADINNDGLRDIATGWEEGGLTRVYLHPGHAQAKQPWPMLTVGKTPDVEDAVFVDLDGDGQKDVVSCSEGETRRVYVHWAPTDPNKQLDESAWQQDVLAGEQQWMFAWPMDVDGRGGIDLVAGSKAGGVHGGGAQVGWFEAPAPAANSNNNDDKEANARDLSAYRWHPMTDAGWIMSIWQRDMDGDGDTDVVISDRYGPLRGCRWLENPGVGSDAARAAQRKPWKNHFMGATDREVLSMTLNDLNGDGLEDAIVATRENELLVLTRLDKTGDRWRTDAIATNFDTGFTRAVEVADIDGDGQKDLAVTSANATLKHGVYWLQHNTEQDRWLPRAISGADEGIKYDRIEMIDLDGDGDLDLLTCEEQEAGSGLGVIWYENPHGKSTQ